MVKFDSLNVSGTERILLCTCQIVRKVITINWEMVFPPLTAECFTGALRRAGNLDHLLLKTFCPLVPSVGVFVMSADVKQK